MSFKGTLASFVETLYSGSGIKQGQLVGKVFSIARPEITIVLARDAEDWLHLLLSPAPVAPAPLPSLASMTCAVGEWQVAGRKAQSYIDVVCEAPRDAPLRRPFLSFCEDVIHELTFGNDAPEASLGRVFVRWRRFWAPDGAGEFSIEWLKGLFGELVVLKQLVDRASAAVESWIGPTDPNRDFSGHGIGLEVKTTTARPPVAKIHSLAQLDADSLRSLFLVVVLLAHDGNGRALNEIVRELDGLLEATPAAHETFLERLRKAGYRRELEDRYSEHRFSTEDVRWFEVTEEFPKITRASFQSPPDSRILGVEYMLDLSGLASHASEAETVLLAIDQLCGRRA